MQAMEAHSDSARSSAIHSARKFEDLVQEDMMICCYQDLQNRPTSLVGFIGMFNTFFVYGLKLRKHEKCLAHGSPATYSDFTNQDFFLNYFSSGKKVFHFE